MSLGTVIFYFGLDVIIKMYFIYVHIHQARKIISVNKFSMIYWNMKQRYKYHIICEKLSFLCPYTAYRGLVFCLFHTSSIQYISQVMLGNTWRTKRPMFLIFLNFLPQIHDRQIKCLLIYIPIYIQFTDWYKNIEIKHILFQERTLRGKCKVIYAQFLIYLLV